MPALDTKNIVLKIAPYDSAANTANNSALVTLNRIEEFSGIQPMAVTDSDTSLQDAYESEVPTGKGRFEPITLTGIIVKAASAQTPHADSAFSRIGRPSLRADYPARKFEVTHGTGFTQSIMVRVRKNAIMEETDKVLRFEAELIPAARAEADYTETGF